MNVQFDTDNAEWELARRCVEQTGCNLFLTGRAGTGKTTFLRALRESTAKRVVVAAPTGVAAINAGGVTLHSFFQLPLGVLLPGAESENERRYTFSKEKRAIVEGLDLLVIDEISMVRADVLDAVDAVLRRLRNDESPFGGVQLLLIGDLRQLPPVAKDDEWEILRQAYETPYFFGSRALARAPYRCIELQHVYRQQDAGFLDLLNAVRDGNPGPAVLDALNRRVLRQPPTATPAPDDGIVLCTHNAQAQSLNEERLRALPGTARRYDAEVKGTFPETSWPTEGGLDLKVGSQVMFLKNDPDKRFYNGRIGRVTRLCDGGRVAVRCDGDAADIEVGPMSWENLRYSTDPESGQLKQEVAGTFSQLPLKLSWAITVHKSQGLTFDRVRLLADRSFAPGQVYVALSRCRTLEGLALERPLPASAIQVDPAIDRYVREIESRRVTEDTLREDRLLYRNRVLANVFRFRDLGRAAYRLRRTADTDAPSLAPGVARALQDLYEVVSLDIEDVGRRFVRHLENALASWFDADSLPPALAERLGKAAAYYLPILEEKVLAALERLDLATDNRAVAHALRRDASALAAAARVKIAAMRSLEDGFSVEGLLRDMAAARFDAAGSAAAPGKRGRRGKTADAADTSVAGATVAPEGLEGAEELVRALRAFRQGVAREKHWPPYMVFSQKAWNGIAYMRGLPQSTKDRKSAAQLVQRDFFREVQDLVCQLSYEQLVFLFPNSVKGMSRRNLLVKQLSADPLVAEGSKHVDLASITSLGNAPTADLPDVTISASRSTVTIAWDAENDWRTQHGDEYPTICVLNVTQKKIFLVHSTVTVGASGVQSFSLSHDAFGVGSDEYNGFMLSTGGKIPLVGFATLSVNERPARPPKKSN